MYSQIEFIYEMIRGIDSPIDPTMDQKEKTVVKHCKRYGVSIAKMYDLCKECQ